MDGFSRETKYDIYAILKQENYIQALIENGKFMDVVSTIWNVYEMPATGNDFRFHNYGNELNKHYVLNNDWNTDEVFVSHLKIYADDTIFAKFVESILNANNIKGNLPIKILEIDQLLTIDGYTLSIDNTTGVHRFTIHPNEELLNEIPDNSTPFYVQSVSDGYRSDNMRGHESPPEFPAFVLVHNSGWNDYGCYSWFSLFYYNADKDDATFIGDVKIISRNEDHTYGVIDKIFYRLTKNFCSLGLYSGFYNKLRNVFGQKAWSIAKALNDCACFSEIEEDFAADPNFASSLCRENSSERALREGRFLLAGYDMRESYHFTYRYRPKYDTDSIIPIDFNFKYDSQPYERIIGFIGENGVGKTCLLRDITDSLSTENRHDFNGALPFYSKVIVVSYSPFDHFAKPQKHDKFRYQYCGLMKNDRELFSTEEQTQQFIDNLRTIMKRRLSTKFLNLVKIIVEDKHLDNINDCLEDNEIEIADWKRKYSDTLKKMCAVMSSGQLNYLLATASVVANIRFDALLLFDEPEQHLHPNAVTLLIKGISTLLEKFKSYAIIATHSPLIIRELVSQNVYILTRDEDSLNVAKIPIECFGEDIAILNDTIFGNKDQEKRFEEFISRLVNQGKTYEQILDLIESSNRYPLSMTAKLLIKRILLQKQ